MSWHRVIDLEIEEEPCPPGASLWTRGGLEGLEIHVSGKTIKIPRDTILELVGSEMASAEIVRIGQMTGLEFLKSVLARL